MDWEGALLGKFASPYLPTALTVIILHQLLSLCLPLSPSYSRQYYMLTTPTLSADPAISLSPNAVPVVRINWSQQAVVDSQKLPI